MSYLDPYFMKYSSTARSIWAFIVWSRLIPVSLRRLCRSTGITTVTRLRIACRKLWVAYFCREGEPNWTWSVQQLSQRMVICTYRSTELQFCKTTLKPYWECSFSQPHLLCLYLTGMTRNHAILNKPKMGKNYVCYTSPLYISFFITSSLRSFSTYLKNNYIGN